MANKPINKEEWNDFILRNGGSFLQSFEWGEFQKSLGRKIWRIKDDSFQALIVKHNLPFGRSYFYCPRGPVANFQLFLEEIKKLAEKERAIFFRIDPEWLAGEGKEEIIKKSGFVKSFKEVQPKKTLILDLLKPEEEILEEMHKKTRYNIHVAKKHDVKFLIFNSKFLNNYQNHNFQNYFEGFWGLLEQTAKRDKFKPHPKEYYKKMLNLPFARLFFADCKGEIIAANILIFFGKRATYLHGASDFNHRNLMAPYFLHWQQILEAKKIGCAEYDFWGIDGKKWPGLTRFKKGFGGEEKEYIGAWDLVFDKKFYFSYKIANRFLAAF